MAECASLAHGCVRNIAGRLPMPPMSWLDPLQRAAVQAPIDGPRKGVHGPFLPLLCSPVLLDRVAIVGAHLRWLSGPDSRVRELAYCVAARHAGNHFGWAMQAQLGDSPGRMTASFSDR